MSKKGLNLEQTLKNLNKTFGENTVNRMKDFKNAEISFISTGSLVIDSLLGGGLGEGKVVEIFGPESSGKTTLAIHAMAECQKNGGTAAMIDLEHAFDPSYAKAIGVDTEKLILSQPEYGEAALQIAIDLAETGEVDLIVIDSVSALTPKKAVQGEVGDHLIGLQAKMLSQTVPVIVSRANLNKCTFIFINQIRYKIGVLFGSPETTSGGQALKFYASQRIDIRRSSIIKEGEIAVANKVKVKVIKNKLAAPFAVGFTAIKYGEGFSIVGEILALAEEFEIVIRKGSWYSYDGTNLAQGEAKTLMMLEDNPELLDEIELKVREKMKGI